MIRVSLKKARELLTTKARRELKQLQFLSKKALQAHRIRLKLMQGRRKLLEKIEHNFANIANNPRFYSTLDITLKREEQLLEIAKRSEKGEENILLAAIQRLRVYYRKYGNKDTPLTFFDIDGKKISGSDAGRFIMSMIQFLEQINRDLSNVEQRMEIERRFIESKSPEHFKDFLDAWGREQESNNQTLQDYLRLIQNNDDVLRSPVRNMTRVWQGGVVGTAFGIGGIGTLFVPKMGLEGSIAVWLGGLLAVLAAWIDSEGELIKGELIETSKDKQILRDLNAMNPSLQQNN